MCSRCTLVIKGSSCQKSYGLKIHKGMTRGEEECAYPSTRIIALIGLLERTHPVDVVFDRCVDILIVSANAFGITYKEINVWIFVIIWPILTILLAAKIVQQRKLIRRLIDSLRVASRWG